MSASTPTIFFRIAWMREYKGKTKTDIPIGAGSHVKLNEDGGEACNFLSINDKKYGFVRVRKGQNIRIERLGATKKATEIKNIRVVFFSRDPEAGQNVVVGWYNNATIYRTAKKLSTKKRMGYPTYVAVAEDTKLLEPENRFFPVPKDGPGRTNIWYVNEYRKSTTYLKNLNRYLNRPSGFIGKTKGKRNIRTPWQQDAEKRKLVENVAMNKVCDYFGKKFQVSYVHTEKKGWDLEAYNNTNRLLIEVKGFSGLFKSLLLTPNEYKMSVSESSYRIAVVENCLMKKNLRLFVFFYDKAKNCWIDTKGNILKIKIVKSAILSF